MRRFIASAFRFAALGFCLMLGALGAAFAVGQAAMQYERTTNPGSGTASSPSLDTLDRIHELAKPEMPKAEPAKPIEKPVSKKYCVVREAYEGVNTAGVTRIIVMEGEGKLIARMVPDAYRTYFNKADEGQNLPLPPHASEWRESYSDGDSNSPLWNLGHYKVSAESKFSSSAIYLFDDTPKP